MSGDVLWQPSDEALASNQMAQFIDYVNNRHNLHFTGYDELYAWSIEQIPDFWESFMDYSGILLAQTYEQIVDDPGKMPGAKWFSGARLNFAENLLRRDDEHTAIQFYSEGYDARELSYAELNRQVRQVASALKELGVTQGDRVVATMPNIPEAVIAMLATASIGAIWSSSSPDFGIDGVLDRFRQIQPKVLFAADGYFYNGKTLDTMEKLGAIVEQLPELEQVIVVPYTRQPDLGGVDNAVLWDAFLAPDPGSADYAYLPFDHPLTIMYSSGTTGLPKSIVHSAGGTLIQHLKELRLHTNLTAHDTIFYFTTCGWMMWNWLVSSLAVGATLVLYDGSPFHGGPGKLWELAETCGITVFGTSAKYLSAVEAAGYHPGKQVDVSKLRAILSTGSPLSEDSFDFVYEHIKTDVQLASISGGTDIISCFALGNPMLPVRRGRLQCRGLGMKVESFDHEGQVAKPGIKGELVCTAAFPSMPVYFWNDEDGSKYHRAYFDSYEDVWRHGDYISIDEDGSVAIFGRSDATLNPGGVRIGTAEIYRVVEKLTDVEDSLVIGFPMDGQYIVVLFLKLATNNILDEQLIESINTALRTSCSPRHVPNKIVQVPDIPYTINGKKVEIAVKEVLMGENPKNRDALANPESLDFYSKLAIEMD